MSRPIPCSFIRNIFLGLVLAMALPACGGGGKDADISPGEGVGTVAILLTDAPNRAFDEIWLTVTRLELLSEERRVTLYSGSETVNLLNLDDHASLFSVTSDVPAGNYDKMRLMVEDIKLVAKADDGSVVEEVHPKVAGGGKIDLNPRSQFVVTPGEMLMVQIDVDGEQSIHIHESGSGKYQFRPVIFIKMIHEDTQGKLVRLQGEVRDIDGDNDTFDLCHINYAIRSSSDDSDDDEGNHNGHGDDEDDDDGHSNDEDDDDYLGDRCVNVSVSPETSFFNGGGEWVSFNHLREGAPATVVGRFDMQQRQDQGLGLRALVVELGSKDAFRRVSGVVTSSIDAHKEFALDPDEGQGVVTAGSIKVAVTDNSKIFSRAGVPLDESFIETGARVKVEGVLQLSDREPDKIIAALVFVDTENEFEKLSGHINDLNVGSRSFNLVDSELGDRCIFVPASADLFEVTVADGEFSSTAIDMDQLSNQQQVEVYGAFDLSGCFVADNILAEAL